MKKKLVFLISLAGMFFSTNISAGKVVVNNKESASISVMIMGDF